MAFSSRRGDAYNSHHRFCPPISTSSGKLLKLSRRLIFSARTRSVSENRPDSHELPASSWSSGFPSTSVTSMLRARAKRAETCVRSEEHTSELQSLMRISYAVFCLTKKKQHEDT